MRGLSFGSSRRASLLAMAGAALLLAAVLAPGAQAHTAEFQSLAPSPAPLTAFTVDPGTGLLYAQEDNGTSYFVYDPRTNVWTELAPAPINSGNNGGAAYLNGKIYVSYTVSSTEIAVYDIATNSWTTFASPLEYGTGDITSGNGLLYLAREFEFFSYNPATEVATPLAEPPEFEEFEGSCGEGFEPWGGLQFDGTRIYGHEGNGCRGFAVYDIAANSWRELPYVPEVEEEEGAVLGSALDPLTNTYLAVGPYEGTNLYRYDLEGNSWSVGTLPFEVEDSGLAYDSLAGHEGVYIIQGESGEEFTRYVERNVTDLATSIAPSLTGTSSGGEITYSIPVQNAGPERAGATVLSDTLPAGATLLSAVPSQGSCAPGATVSCSLGTLHSGVVASVTIKVAAGFGTVTNTATVSSLALDSNPANNTATSVVAVAPPAVKCVVPKLRGRNVKGAKKALRRAHCRPGKVIHRFNRKVKKRRVIRGSKRTGKKLAFKAKVNLIVSRGAKHRKRSRHGRQ